MSDLSANFSCIAIETATKHASVAVCNGLQEASVELVDSQQSSREIYKAIATALDETGLRKADVKCIAFGQGPGSFTGVRVAASAAQGLAYALQVPVCRVSTLAALAWNAHIKHGVDSVIACLDARMGEAYVGHYRCKVDAIAAISVDALVHPDSFAIPSEAAGGFAAGDGWGVWPQMLGNDHATEPGMDTDVWPTAIAILQLARFMHSSGDTVSPENALPNYLRDKVTHS